MNRAVFSNRSLFQIITYGHECWVNIEKVQLQVQAAAMGILHKAYSVTLGVKERSCEIRTILDVEPLLRIEIPATMVRPRDQNAPGKIGEPGLAGHIHGKPAQRSSKGQGGLIAPPTLGPILVWS